MPQGHLPFFSTPSNLVLYLTIFHLVSHNSFLNGLPLTCPHARTGRVILHSHRLCPTSQPLNMPVTLAIAGGLCGPVAKLRHPLAHLLPWGFSNTTRWAIRGHLLSTYADQSENAKVSASHETIVS